MLLCVQKITTAQSSETKQLQPWPWEEKLTSGFIFLVEISNQWAPPHLIRSSTISGAHSIKTVTRIVHEWICAIINHQLWVDWCYYFAQIHPQKLFTSSREILLNRLDFSTKKKCKSLTAGRALCRRHAASTTGQTFFTNVSGYFYIPVNASSTLCARFILVSSS